MAALMLALVPGAGAAGDPGVTFTSTQTIPVPPASNYAGQGGGDGWGIALRADAGEGHPSAEYNVFHHSSQLTVACHLQSNAQACWSPKTVTSGADVSNPGFAVGGHVGMYLDQQTNKLYVYATRESDTTSGIVCFDTIAADNAGANPFCGFTALSAVGEGAWNGSGSYLGEPMLVGGRWFAFNYVSGAAPAGGTSHTENTLLCFDTTTAKACASPDQPYPMNIGSGTLSSSNFPPPGEAAIGNDLIVSMYLQPTSDRASTDLLACFDGVKLADCTGGSWPVEMHTNYPSSAGAPFPLLSASGTVQGVCLPYNTGQVQDPCWNLDGSSAATPAGLSAAVPQTSPWSGQAVVIGPRVYLPDGNQNSVECYDYNAGSCNPAGASIFPKRLANLSLMYSINADPQRPTCLWANADNGGAQIQNFDAFTGGPCGQGPIRLPGSFFVVNAPACTPGSYTSLQITDPAPTSYKSGTVSFADGSGNALTAQPITLDASGIADLQGLSLNSNSGLPQFLITLDRGDNASPTSVTVKLTWTGAFDAACGNKAGTTIVNPPVTTPPPATPPPAPPTPNIRVTAGGPPVARVGNNVTFTATVTNTSNSNEETGAELKAPIPAGSTLVSVTASQGVCPTGTQIFCALGTIATGASANVTVVVKANQAGTLTFNPTIAGDYDTSAADNTTSVSTPAEAPGAVPPAPPAPTTPGTVNAISVGTVIVNGVSIPPDTYFTLKAGDSVQLNGVLVFTTIAGNVGTFSNVPFTGSRNLSALRAWLHAAETGPTSSFTVTAVPAAVTDTTDLTLTGGDFSGCSAPRKLSAKPAPNSAVVRQLWGQAHGNFRTTGHYSSATIRGTTWGVQDRCDGTMTTAVDDFVTVVDTVLGKTLTLKPGQTYLAQPKPFTPPTQKHKPTTKKTPTKANTRASVLASGLVWSGHRFKTKQAFSVYLSKHGSSWAAWAKKHAVLAAALATR